MRATGLARNAALQSFPGWLPLENARVRIAGVPGCAGTVPPAASLMPPPAKVVDILGLKVKAA